MRNKAFEPYFIMSMNYIYASLLPWMKFSTTRWWLRISTFENTASRGIWEYSVARFRKLGGNHTISQWTFITLDFKNICTGSIETLTSCTEFENSVMYRTMRTHLSMLNTKTYMILNCNIFFKSCNIQRQLWRILIIKNPWNFL